MRIGVAVDFDAIRVDGHVFEIGVGVRVPADRDRGGEQAGIPEQHRPGAGASHGEADDVDPIGVDVPVIGNELLQQAERAAVGRVDRQLGDIGRQVWAAGIIGRQEQATIG